MGNICPNHGVRLACNLRRTLLCVMASLLLTMQSEAHAQVRKLYPYDESRQDRSFVVFRTQLLAALKRRDLAHLLSVLHPNIMNSFGGDDGVANFMDQWQPRRPDSKIWGILANAIKLGGTFEGSGKERMFCAPYVYTRFPDELDSFTHQAIIGKHVPVRSQPAVSAPVIGVLSYDIVRVKEDAAGDESENNGWVKVVLKSGAGYVPKSLIRSPIDYRVCFQRVERKWLMTLLVAGD